MFNILKEENVLTNDKVIEIVVRTFNVLNQRERQKENVFFPVIQTNTEMKMVLVVGVMMEQGINLYLNMNVKNVISQGKGYIMWMKMVIAKEVHAKDLVLSMMMMTLTWLLVNCVEA